MTKSALRRFRAETDDGKGPHELEAAGYVECFDKLRERGYALTHITALSYWQPLEEAWGSADDLLYALRPDWPGPLPRRRGQHAFTGDPPDPAGYLAEQRSPGGA